MNSRIAFTCFLAPLAIVNAVSAQEAAPTPTPIIEAFSCTYNGSNDRADLNAVTARWNTWSDRNNITNYFAAVLTPYLHSDQLMADVLWLGAWPNGEAMGKEEAVWMSKGQDMNAEFEAVVDCASHAQYAEVVVRQPQGQPPESGIAEFSNCTVQEGRTVDEALAALGQWSQYLTENGGNNFEAVWFAVAGESPDIKWDFKTLTGFESIEAYGRNLDVITRGGYQRADELFGRLLDCDSSRVYVFDTVRRPAPAQ